MGILSSELILFKKLFACSVLHCVGYAAWFFNFNCFNVFDVETSDKLINVEKDGGHTPYKISYARAG